MQVYEEEEEEEKKKTRIYFYTLFGPMIAPMSVQLWFVACQ